MLKDAFRGVAVLLAGIVLATAAMLAVSALPVERIHENLSSDGPFMAKEGTYPKLVNGGYFSQLDNFTDAIILNEAIFDGPQGLMDRAMNVYHTEWDGVDKVSCFNMASMGIGNGQAVSYTRYWHGYLVLLKPLFMVFSYSQLRAVNGVCQLLLVCLAVLLLLRRRGLGRYALALVFVYLAMYPPALGSSLQFCPCFYIALLAVCALLRTPESAGPFRFRLIFLLSGMATAFFDFLTYPLLTWGLPMTVYILLQKRRGWPMYVDLAAISLFWCAGYGGMWAGKWVVASLLTGANAFTSAFSTIEARTSLEAVDAPASLADVYVRQLSPLWQNTGFVLAAAAAVAVYLVRGVRRGFRPLLGMPALVPLVGVALAPFVWYTVAGAHSYIHFWFTFRTLGMTVFAGLCLLIGWGSGDAPASTGPESEAKTAV